MHDAACAIRWFRANADKYGLDPSRIGVIGHGSGAHPAMMVGFMDNVEVGGGCEDLSYSTRVQAVVNISGPTDLGMWHEGEAADINYVWIDEDEPSWTIADMIEIFVGG